MQHCEHNNAGCNFTLNTISVLFRRYSFYQIAITFNTVTISEQTHAEHATLWIQGEYNDMQFHAEYNLNAILFILVAF